MRRLSIGLIFLAVFCLINTHALNDYFELEKEAYAEPAFGNLSHVLSGIKPSELSLCMSFVRGSGMDSKQIADAIFSWDPEKNKRKIGVVFRTKITSLTERLRRIDYEQLIIDIDLIKNSHMTTGQIIRLLQGLNITRRPHLTN